MLKQLCGSIFESVAHVVMLNKNTYVASYFRCATSHVKTNVQFKIVKLRDATDLFKGAILPGTFFKGVTLTNDVIKGAILANCENDVNNYVAAQFKCKQHVWLKFPSVWEVSMLNVCAAQVSKYVESVHVKCMLKQDVRLIFIITRMGALQVFIINAARSQVAMLKRGEQSRFDDKTQSTINFSC